MALFGVACTPDLVKTRFKSDALEISMIDIETILQSFDRQPIRTRVVHTDSIKFTIRFYFYVVSYSSNLVKI